MASDLRIGSWVNRHRLETVFVILVLVGIGVTRFPTLRQPLLEAHGFRQTQTAYTAVIFHEEGVDLLHPELPVLGEPWEVPFEFPLFQANAAAVMSLGVPPDPAMRITALGWFTATALVMWALVRYVTRDALAAGAALFLFAFSPFALLLSRTSLIEFMATAGAIGWALAAILWLNTRRMRWAFVAVTSGALGMLVKPTTAVFWVVPIVAWALQFKGLVPGPTRFRQASLAAARRLLEPALLAVLILPVVIGLWWVGHADAIKSASPLTNWLTSENLRLWNFGTLDQRQVMANWLVIADRAEPFIIGRWLGMPLVLIGLLMAPRRWFWLAIAATAVLPVVVFFNLYVVHDYYLSAVSPAAAMLLGIGVSQVAGIISPSLSPRVVGACVGALWLGVSLSTTTFYWRPAYWELSPSLSVAVADDIKAVASESDRIVVVGLDWSPATLYYAQRRGVMLKVGPLENEEVAADLAGRGYEVFVAADPFANRLDLATAWKWMAPAGRFSYRVGATASEVMPWRVAGTTDIAEFASARAAGLAVLTVPEVLVCGSPLTVSAPETGALWLRLGDADPVARVLVGGASAPLPVTPVLVVVGTGPTTLDCAGVADVTILEQVVGPAPRGS